MLLFRELALPFRAVIVSVSSSEKTHASTYLFFFFFFVSHWIRYFRSSLSYLKFEKSFSAMGDIEAPESDRPRQTVLLSVLPSKEFASSRKGMLLIAEVVRNEQRNIFWNKWSCYCAIVSPKTHKRQGALTLGGFCFLPAVATLEISCFSAGLELILHTVVFSLGQSVSATRFPLEKGGAASVYYKVNV